MEAPQTTASRRWPSLGRIAASALLGSVVAGAIVPLFSSPRAPSVRAVAPAALAPAAATAPALAPAPVAEPAPPPIEQLVSSAPAVAPPVAAPAVTPPAPRAVVHPPDAPHVTGRSVQVGAFRDPERAGALRDELAKQFEWVMVTRVVLDGVVWHRVRIEGLENAAAVQNALAALRRAGHQPIVVR
jgi:cell division protein FtsN